MIKIEKDFSTYIYTSINNNIDGAGAACPTAVGAVGFFETGQIIEANIIKTKGEKIDIKFEDGRLAFNIDKDKVSSI